MKRQVYNSWQRGTSSTIQYLYTFSMRAGDRVNVNLGKPTQRHGIVINAFFMAVFLSGALIAACIVSEKICGCRARRSDVNQFNSIHN